MSWKNQNIGNAEIHPCGDIDRRNYFLSGFVDAYNIINALNFPYEKKILEYGCGNGRIMSHLKFFDIEGVDINEKFINESKNLNLNCELLNNNNKNDYYDIIYSFTVFIHLKENEVIDALNYINKKLKKNGECFVQIPLYDEKRIGISYIDINCMTVNRLKEICNETGFILENYYENKGKFEYNSFGINHDKLHKLIKK